MKIGTLTKLKNKVKLNLTPKHPFYFQPVSYKIIYGAGVFLHAKYHPGIKPLSNPELLRLLSRGFLLNSQETAAVLSLSLRKQDTIDQLIDMLKNTKNKYFFLMDLINVCMRDGDLSKDELYSIQLFADLFEIDENTQKAIRFFLRSAFREDKKMLLLSHGEMLSCLPNEYRDGFSMDHLTYYTCFMESVTKITRDNISPDALPDWHDAMKSYVNGCFRNFFTDHCEVQGDITIPKGTSICFQNATIKLYGSFFLQGGSLIFSNCTIVMKKSAGFMVESENSLVIFSNTNVDLRHFGALLSQKKGRLEMNKVKITGSTGKSCISLSSVPFYISDCEFRNCHTSGNGAALNIREGRGHITDCGFFDCEATYGGAIDTTSDTTLRNCTFYLCKAVAHGAAIYYRGEIRSNIENCQYYDSYPEKEELVQEIKDINELHIRKTYEINCSTILSVPVTVHDLGVLEIKNSVVYLSQPIHCKGILNIKNSSIIASGFKERDMLVLDHAKNCSVSYSEFDGNLSCGIFRAPGTRFNIFHSIFRNCKDGRAIYDAHLPVINECIFSYCLGGAIYCRLGKITQCIFVNCTGQIGAAIQMEGKNGEVSSCRFLHCVSYYKKGAIDMTPRRNIKDCIFVDCDP